MLADFKPAYPSSSSKKHDWDQVEKEIKKQEETEPDEDINSLFAKIYNSGDENTKRAMMKSMVNYVVQLLVNGHFVANVLTIDLHIFPFTARI